MSYHQTFRRNCLAPLLASCCCLVAALPVRAQDASPAPVLANHVTPDLRPPSTDGATTASTDADLPASSAPAAAPVPAADSSPAASVVASAPDQPPPVDVAANTPAPSTGASASVDALAATPSQNVTINLINLMVKRNLITREDADALIKQAEQEADVARAQAAATQAKAERALAAQAAPPVPAPAPAPAADDEVRIAYVPDLVKKQITDQVTQNVMEQTREEHLADTIAASSVPDWVKRFHVAGDIRVRYEGDDYPSGNAIGNFFNFNSINTSASGFNVIGTTPPPQYDVDQNRDRFRLRARIGAEIDLGNGFTSGMRIATGSDDSPVTENQTLGGANSAQGGNFGKYQIWLDRAFIRYEWGGQPNKDLTFTIGRFDNPFFHTSMLWADDLAFDGAAVQGKYEVVKGVTPFLSGGAFPVFNTDLNFSTDQSSKFSSEDKYLFAVQSGVTWTINKDFSLKAAGAYYDFENIQGKVSDPIGLADANSVGNTDDSRPAFAQNGNTYIALRDFTDPAPTTENQFFGLATPFHVVAVTAKLDYSHFDPFHMSITGEVIKNVAFDRNAIINNGPISDPGPQNNLLNNLDPNSFDGGDMGYMVRLDLGKVDLAELWDWNVQLSYRYVQSDATVDGFTDADFGGNLVGTNLKGYTIGGNLALSSRVWAGLRVMSADAVAGPTYKNDLLQFDINAKF